MKNWWNFKNLSQKNKIEVLWEVKGTEMEKDKVILKTQNLHNHTKEI